MAGRKLETKFSRRQTMLNENVEINYYNEIQYASVEEHAHDFYELYQILEGSVEFSILDQSYCPNPGDILIVPPGRSHHLSLREKETPYRRIVIWIRREYIEQLIRQDANYSYLFELAEAGDYLWKLEHLTANHLQSMAFDMIEENWNARFGKAAMLQLQLSVYLLTLGRAVYESRNRQARNAGSEENVYQQICTYINYHLGDNLSLEELAHQFFLSKYYIAHLFKEKVGMSAHQYITKKRLAACRDAMFENRSINEICTEYGFSEYTSFYRMFRREYGQSPNEYRKAHLPSGENG